MAGIESFSAEPEITTHLVIQIKAGLPPALLTLPNHMDGRMTHGWTLTCIENLFANHWISSWSVLFVCILSSRISFISMVTTWGVSKEYLRLNWTLTNLLQFEIVQVWSLSSWCHVIALIFELCLCWNAIFIILSIKHTFLGC